MTIGVIIFTILVLVAWVGVNFWKLLASQKGLEAAWVNLERQLVLRRQTISEIIQAFKDRKLASQHEKLEQAHALAQGESSADLAKKAWAEDDLGSALGQYLQELEKDSAFAESDDYLKLKNKIMDIEDEVTALRSKYNELVGLFNMQQKVFPTRIIVSKTGIGPRPEFQMEDAFIRYPLKIKATLPIKKPSIFIGEDSEVKTQ